MTNQGILQKAIDTAVKNGWDFKSWKAINNLSNSEVSEYRVNDLIFNHIFAKALWGSVIKHNISDTGSNGIMNGHFLHLDRWQWKLMQMVIATDPLKYLYDNLPNNSNR